MIDYVLAVYTGGKPLFSTRLRGQAPTGMQNYYKTMKKTIFARINKKKDKVILSNRKGQPCLIGKQYHFSFSSTILPIASPRKPRLSIVPSGAKRMI